MLHDTRPEDSEPSKALLDVLAKINTITELKSMTAARVWVKNNGDLNDFERDKAFEAINSLTASLEEASKKAA